MNRIISLQEKKLVFSKYLRSMKKMLPKNCTFLALMTRRDGEIVVRSVIDKKEYMLSIPQDFAMTEADLNRLHELLYNKCQQDVTEGN